MSDHTKFIWTDGTSDEISLTKIDDNFTAKYGRQKADLKELIIGKDVRSIEANAFKMCKNLEKVDMSPSVEKISVFAFAWCEKLTEIDLPEGLDTVIGERGHGLSEGQAQRIAIARAFLRRAPFLILDEATSALDEATEVAVLQGLRALEPRPTCLLITHRKGVLKYCDRELCIREGSVTEECSTTTICTA